EQGRRVHLFDQLTKTVGREPRVDPRPVGGEVELRNTHQEVVGPEAVEGLEPRGFRLEVARKLVDIGGARGNHAPAEYSNSSQRGILHGGSEPLACPQVNRFGRRSRRPPASLYQRLPAQANGLPAE